MKTKHHLLVVCISINILFVFFFAFEDVSIYYYVDDSIRFVVMSRPTKSKREMSEQYKPKQSITSAHCPKCGSANIIMWGRCSKTMYNKYHNPVRMEGFRVMCKNCNKTTCRYPPSIDLWQRLLPETVTHLVTQKMYKGCGYRNIGREDYSKAGFSASTCWNVVQKYGPEAKEILKRIPKDWSETLVVDEKYEKCKNGTIMWLVAGMFFRDKKGHQYCCIIKAKAFYIEATEESRKDKRKLKKEGRDLLAKENPRFFQELAGEIDDPTRIKAVVTDLENTYPNAIKEAFPNARHQLCLQHVVESAKRNFVDELGKKNMTEEDQELLKELYSLPNIKSEQDYEVICKHFLEWRFENKSRIKEIRKKKGKKTNDNMGVDWWYNHTLSRKKNICVFIDIANCPPTSNSIESQFSRVKPRTYLMKSFQSESGAKNYLDLMAVYLNVAKFSDGHNRGSSIIELAGINLEQNIFP